jgi:Leu/Phe-tRNA-protein transferase
MIENGTKAALYNVTAPLHPAKFQVIDAQKNKENGEEVTEVKGKVVLSSKLVSELGYVFEYPDPRKFHEI